MSAYIRDRKYATGVSNEAVAAFCGVSAHAVRSWLYYNVIPSKKNLAKLDELFEEKKDGNA